MKQYTEASINKILAEIQLASTLVQDEDDNEDSYENLIRKALASENEAIEIYLKLKEKAEQQNSKLLVKAFNEIKEDEQKHVGNLNYLLELLCPKAVDNEVEGKTEEMQLQAEVTNGQE